MFIVPCRGPAPPVADSAVAPRGNARRNDSLGRAARRPTEDVSKSLPLLIA